MSRGHDDSRTRLLSLLQTSEIWFRSTSNVWNSRSLLLNPWCRDARLKNESHSWRRVSQRESYFRFLFLRRWTQDARVRNGPTLITSSFVTKIQLPLSDSTILNTNRETLEGIKSFQSLSVRVHRSRCLDFDSSDLRADALADEDFHTVELGDEVLDFDDVN